MTAEDLDEILKIEGVSFPKPWTRDHFEVELKNPISYAYTLKIENEGNETIGAYIIFWVVHGEAHILNIAVHPALRGRGFAAGLLKTALEQMRRNMVCEVFLEVRMSNMAAINLYRKFGFKEGFIRKNYYEDEDAIVMTLVF